MVTFFWPTTRLPSLELEDAIDEQERVAVAAYVHDRGDVPLAARAVLAAAGARDLGATLCTNATWLS